MNYAKAEFFSSFGISSQLPQQDRPEVVFSGRSNVGKSSLINKLCNRKSLARVSSTPGKTATINYYNIDDIYFVDLPGYGYAKVSNSERKRWDELINNYFKSARENILLVQLLDCRHSPSKDDVQMLEYLKHYNVHFVVALTKADKLKKAQLEGVVQEFTQICAPYNCDGVVLTSAQNAYGIEQLKLVIDTYVSELSIAE